MKPSPFLLLAAALAVRHAVAAPPSSTHYALPALGITSGGSTSTSANYGQISSMGLVMGVSNGTAPGTTAHAGLLPQLIEAPPAPPGVSVLGLTKTRHHSQTAAAVTSASSFSMSAFIEGAGLSLTFPSGSNRFRPSGGSDTFLTLDVSAGSWGYEQSFATQGLLDAAYPHGSYTFLVGTSPAISLSFPATSYPVVPVVTASAGTWSGGKLLLTPAQAAAGLTLTSNASNGDGFLTMEVFSASEDILYEEITDNPGLNAILTGHVPAGSLDAGQTYDVYTEFDKVVHSTSIEGQSWAVPGAEGFALLSSNTHFQIHVLTALELWRLQFFGTIANGGNAADTADEDGDGVVNFMEWAAGLSPSNSAPLNTPAEVTGATIEFIYQRSVAAASAGAAFIVEWSDTLPGTSWSSTGVSQQVISDNGTLQQVKATLPAGSGNKRFVRLRVVAPAS